ncbi:hypothetical protein U1Q18_048998 [Sarracenia purpurea var. burkii]
MEGSWISLIVARGVAHVHFQDNARKSQYLSYDQFGDIDISDGGYEGFHDVNYTSANVEGFCLTKKAICEKKSTPHIAQRRSSYCNQLLPRIHFHIFAPRSTNVFCRLPVRVMKANRGERLSHAVGCAFAVCLERKQKRDKECSVTMNFDMQNSTFTRTGSFRQQTLTEKLQDTTNVNNNVNNAPVTTPSNNTTSLTNIPPNAVININNSNE